jgi:Flp pilus assembly pilin Flp
MDTTWQARLAKDVDGRMARGQSLAEYGLILVLVAVVVILVLVLLGPVVANFFTNVVDSVSNTVPS